jgi:hypothetical protein
VSSFVRFSPLHEINGVRKLVYSARGVDSQNELMLDTTNCNTGFITSAEF